MAERVQVIFEYYIVVRLVAAADGMMTAPRLPLFLMLAGLLGLAGYAYTSAGVAVPAGRRRSGSQPKPLAWQYCWGR